jgi:hypothetical protein
MFDGAGEALYKLKPAGQETMAGKDGAEQPVQKAIHLLEARFSLNSPSDDIDPTAFRLSIVFASTDGCLHPAELVDRAQPDV